MIHTTYGLYGRRSFLSASCRLTEFGSFVLLEGLTSTERRKGHARSLLLEVTEECREAGVPLRLYVSPFSDRPMSVDQLIRFYESVGFNKIDSKETFFPSLTWMVYEGEKK